MLVIEDKILKYKTEMNNKIINSIIVIVTIAIASLSIFVACTEEDNINMATPVATQKIQVYDNSFLGLDEASINKDVERIKIKYNIEMTSFINEEAFITMLAEHQEYTEFFYQHLNAATPDELELLASQNWIDDFNNFMLYIDMEDYESAASEIQAFSTLFFNEEVTAESLQNNTSALFVSSNEIQQSFANLFATLSNSYEAISFMDDHELTDFFNVALQYRLLLYGNEDPIIICYAPPGTNPQDYLHNPDLLECHKKAEWRLGLATTKATGAYALQIASCSALGPTLFAIVCASAATVVYVDALIDAAYNHSRALELCNQRFGSI